MEITPKLEAILAAAQRHPIIGDELDPDLTALAMAGYLRLRDERDSVLVITAEGLKRLAHEPIEAA